jgi:hypothetical protein
VAIAEVIGDANQIGLAAAGNMQYPLDLCPHEDNPSVVSVQEVAIAQYVTALEEQSDLFAIRQRRAQPALLPQVERQHQFDIKV